MEVLSEIESFFNSSPLVFMRAIPFNKIVFDRRCEYMCKYGCKNYNRKFSCPPDSLQFMENVLKKQYNWTILTATSTLLPENTTRYKKIFLDRQKEFEIQKISNNFHDFFNKNDIDHILLSSGSCKKCQKCSKIYNEECKKPELKITSMEAVGIDCQKTLSDAGFDFEMPARNSINRCMAVLFNCNELSSIHWKKGVSHQKFKRISNQEIKNKCDFLQDEFPQLFESVELIPTSELKQGEVVCSSKCKNNSLNYSCPPYSSKFDFGLWDQCILWKWKENKLKKSSYNMALKKIHSSFFSMGLYFALSVRDCYCNECQTCEYALSKTPVCNFRKLMSPSMQSQGINPSQFGEGKYGLELV
jgi:predicted metal-binding protein